MSVKPYIQELKLNSNKNLKSQSIVESRIAEKDSDIVKIIAVGGIASVIGSETVEGEVRYSGQIIFSLVYENAEEKILRSEYGVEFAHKAERQDILPSMPVTVTLTAENTELKQINGNYVLSAIASADIDLGVENTYKYLSGGENIIVKTEDMPVSKNSYDVKGNYDLFEEIECHGINDILLHSENLILTDVQAGVGCIICDGLVNVNIVYTSGEDDKISNLSKLIDFRFEVDANDAMPNMQVLATATVKSARLNASVDSSKDKSIVATEISLDVTGRLFEDVVLTAATDVYSTEYEVNIVAECLKAEKPMGTKVYNERLVNTAITGGTIDFGSQIIGIGGENTSVQATAVEAGKFTAEGVVYALAVVKGEDGKVSSASLELPFTFEMQHEDVTAASKIKLSGIAYNTSARQKKEGEIEMDTNIKLSASVIDYTYLTVISDINVGDEHPKSHSAISVFIPQRNDELWDVAKRLKEPPESILQYNSELEFPLSGDERIVIYRQNKIDY